MFNNLIESTSHRPEFKRRGSFLLGVLGGYLLLFSAAGLVSVVAFDARLETQNLELVSLITPVESGVETPTPQHDSRAGDERPSRERQSATRTQTPPSSDPTKTRMGIAVQTNQIPPPAGPWIIAGQNSDTDSGTSRYWNTAGPGSGLTGNTGVRPADSEPPPVKRKVPVTVAPPAVKRSGGVLNGIARSLPQPVYSSLALAAHASGEVQVEILIDESGKVISARAITGHALLRPAAEQAALKARFSPTLLTNMPVKVSGVIKYEFVRQ